MKEAASKKRKGFATAHSSDENRQVYICTSRHAHLYVLNQSVLSSVLLLVLLPPLITSSTVLLGSRLRSTPTT